MDDEAREVQFDAHELMAIESVLAPSEIAADGGKALTIATPSRELCLKIGAALLQARASDSATLALTENECWALRERVNIFMSVGQRHDLGLGIKLSLYRMLLDFAFARDVGPLGESDHEERSRRDVAEALYERNNHAGADNPDH